ncbi:hypothetical protein BO70DRAFT_396710 [Aspergillus heteromorphus CBS 117.55]|uniref:Uncharacterized protein n=1 Tax=Aspergillus heteromorphus CBS 117.55 TaxID=1448321 RepID=A0A317W7R0_9EURO|nr:uncharacterized protein BO70DRAFT_396710 [Aspergillus heteromorphus CBS 117.55]PWY81925.1 hypothetical protein BO70DRAFT_396710 [Aspergillus heteromorphus CBS 117.55]
MEKRQARSKTAKKARAKPSQDKTGIAMKREASKKSETAATLKAKIANLEAEYAAFRAEVMEDHTTYKFFGIFQDAQDWCINNIVDSTADLEGLSPNEKQSIIRGLEGYCVQDLDWDMLIGSFPYPICELAPSFLAAALIVKDWMERFVDNPFWYFTGGSDQKDGQNESPGSVAQAMLHVYQQFLEVNPISGSYWKRESVRLASSVHKSQASSTILGPRAYQNAEDFTFRLHASDGYFKYRELCRSARLFFDRQTPWIKAHDLHSLEGFDGDEDSRLDGHRVLLVVSPAGVRFREAPQYEEGRILQPARVVVEHGEWTKEDDVKNAAEYHRVAEV